MFSELPALSPVHFFQIRGTCKKLDVSSPFPKIERGRKNYLLPPLSSLHGEEDVVFVSMGWSEEGIEFLVETDEPFSEGVYPSIDKGDSFEVCLDTRDVKTSGYNTQYCHHFFALPVPFEGIWAGERTHFRTEDCHPLCDPSDLHVHVKSTKKKTALHFLIPRNCLHGYDPGQFDRIGVAYRVNLKTREPQYFSTDGREVAWAEQPSLWSSLRLI